MFVQTPQDMRTLIEEALVEAEAGTMVPFATIERATGKPVGSTRYLIIEPHTAAWRSAGPGSRRRGSAVPSTPRQSC